MNFLTLVPDIRALTGTAQAAAARTADRLLTPRNWLIGAWIVEYEPSGEDRATYRDALIDRLAEELTSAGVQRHVELEEALGAGSAGCVYVSAFLDFREFKRHTDEIALETEVGLAEAPSHLQHCNGDRFHRPRT